MRILGATVLATCLVFGSFAYAQDEAVPVGELKALVVGKTIKSSGARLYYGADGRYKYNGKAPGTYTISKGKICVKFDTGDRRCDRIVKSNGKYHLINAKGKRFPFG